MGGIGGSEEEQSIEHGHGAEGGAGQQFAHQGDLDKDDDDEEAKAAEVQERVLAHADQVFHDVGAVEWGHRQEVKETEEHADDGHALGGLDDQVSMRRQGEARDHHGHNGQQDVHGRTGHGHQDVI